MDETQKKNDQIQEEVNRLENLEEDTGRATWREYMKQIENRHAEQVRHKLALPDLDSRLKVFFAEAGGGDGGLPFGGEKFANFMTQLLQFFSLPAPANGEAVWALLFKKYSTSTSSDKGQKKRLTLEGATILVQTLARVILKAFNLQELQRVLSPFAKAIMESPAWMEELENLKKKGLTGAQGLEEKKKELLEGGTWEQVFGAADVGRSGLLSWNTRQFHVFVNSALRSVGFPDPAGGEEVMRRMFDAFAPESEDLVSEASCKAMAGAVMDAVISARVAQCPA